MVTNKKAKKVAAPKKAKAPKKVEPKLLDEQFPEESKGDATTTPGQSEEPIVRKNDVIGSLKGGKDVHVKNSHLRVKVVRANSVSIRELPEDIRKWLNNKGYGTNVYLKNKEWLEKHNVDPVMVEKLKKFINDRYL